MFNYGNANEAQKEAISATDGLVLITAGPGTGKTFTLVKRAVYLIQECGIKPEQIMMATFTEKAAKELITRITNELAERNVSVNVNEMYIGTFHSLCLRIIKENLEFTRLKRNYRLLDTFDSKPEKECFLQYISSNKVKEIYFTGMFTSNQGDLSVQYYDPESKRLRKYYPDFLALMEDGSYQLIEVKGDNKIDDEVVLAKKAAAEEMAVASGVHYLMYAGSTLMKSNVLEPTLAVQQTSIDI